MGAWQLCGVAPLLLRNKLLGFVGKEQATKRPKAPKKKKKKTKGSTTSAPVRKLNGVAEKFVKKQKKNREKKHKIKDIRRKILIFRDYLDLYPCIPSATINELLICTVKDIHRLYPNTQLDTAISDSDEAPLSKILRCFCDVLKKLGDLWTNNGEWMVKCEYKASDKLSQDQLEQLAQAMLEDMNKLAGERMFEAMDEDDRTSECSHPENAFGRNPSGTYSEGKAHHFSSPATPTSVLPQMVRTSLKRSYSPPDHLLPVSVQSMKKLSPIDIKRLSLHIFSHTEEAAQDPNKPETKTEDVDESSRASEISEDTLDRYSDAKSKSGTPEKEGIDHEVLHSDVDSTSGTPKKEDVDVVPVPHSDVNSKLGTPKKQGIEVVPRCDLHSKNGTPKRQDIDVVPAPASLHKLKPTVSEKENPPPIAPPKTETLLQPIVLSPKAPPSPPTPPPPPPPPPRPPVTRESTTLGSPPQPQETWETTVGSPPRPPVTRESTTVSSPPPTPPASMQVPSTGMKLTLPPPPTRILEKVSSPPPTPPASTQVPSTGMKLTLPPPPTRISGKVSSPPPAPPSHRKGAPPPPPPSPVKGAPPPPPSLGGARNTQLSKTASRLRRSAEMANLYRRLKGKVEGSDLETKSARPGKISAAPGGKQGMADALAEMTKRSAYFIQIEEDVRNHEKSIMQLKKSINSFESSHMDELYTFHKYVESILEKLSDETQVLARFEDFPIRKLETLRMAAALYSKLVSISKALKDWQIESPVGKVLDKLENYFNKIKQDVDTLERTKAEEMQKFKNYKITFDFSILDKIKEHTVDVSSSCMELALKERRDVMEAESTEISPTTEQQKKGTAKVLWKAFQFAYRVYTFAGGHDDRADRLTREIANEIQTDPEH